MLAQVGPGPLRVLLSRRNVAEHRNLFCSRYERCLDEALESGWVSWTCARCLRFTAPRRHEAAVVTLPL